jgi:hypothetical protein
MRSRRRSDIEVRPYLPEDAAILGGVLQEAAYGLTVLSGGAVKALGGFTVIGGKFWAFYHREPGFDCGRVLHRMVRDALRDAAAHGIAPVYVLRDSKYETSRRWLDLLGFQPVQEQDRDEVLTMMERESGLTIWVRHG